MIGKVGGGGGFSIQGAPTFTPPTAQRSGGGVDVARSTFEPARGIMPGGCYPTPKPPVTPPGGGDQTQNLVMKLLQVVLQLLSMLFGRLGQGGGNPGGPGLPSQPPVGDPVPVYGPGMNLAEANAPIFMPYMSKELQDLIGLQNSI